MWLKSPAIMNDLLGCCQFLSKFVQCTVSHSARGDVDSDDDNSSEYSQHIVGLALYC